MPSQCKPIHDWKTDKDAFEDNLPSVLDFRQGNSGVEAKILFQPLREEHPRKYRDRQLRTFQRRVKQWWAVRAHQH